MPTVRSSQPRLPRTLTPEQRLERMVRAAEASVAVVAVDVQEVVDTLQVTTEVAQVAQSSANAAQSTADSALGGGSVSGSAENPTVSLSTNGAWVAGPVVSLPGVVAGNLTLKGSGPRQDSDVDLVSGTTAAGEYRIVEVIAGVDEVLVSGTFSVSKGGSVPATVSNLSTAAISAYSSARSSTGAVGYRIDVRKMSGASIFDLSLYVYARRAA